MNSAIDEVNDENFAAAVLDSKQPVLVDFGRSGVVHAAPSRRSSKGSPSNTAGTARIAKLNVDVSPALAERYRVMAIPTLILFQDGKEKERLIGVSKREAIARVIDMHVSAEAQ